MNFSETKKGFTLVELMIVVAIIGILAAIAIPAFRRYVVSSRVSESMILTDWITKGAVAYYLSEQRFSGPNGDQPWHGGNPVSGNHDSYGMPISASEYVFPGGVYSFNTDEGEGAFVNCATAPSGGSKTGGKFTNKTPKLESVIRKLKLEAPGFMYFQYGYKTAGKGDAAVGQVSAVADFKPGGDCHTNVRLIHVSENEPNVLPIITTFEFQ